jgi:hypothetical protein
MIYHKAITDTYNLLSSNMMSLTGRDNSKCFELLLKLSLNKDGMGKLS